MNLHENPTLFRDSIAFTAQELNILDIYIEKDYWVTYALHLIFHNDIGKETVFKGGTALSKCFGIIQRFSEDIDLVVLRHEGESGNQLKTKLKKITELVAKSLTEKEEPGITNKLGVIRKVAYEYPKLFEGVFGQVREVIVIEATWLGRYEPYNTQQVSSYIYEMMVKTGQEKLVAEYNLLPFKVKVLHVNRTICEKIMSLVRFSYGENPIEDLKNKIRHTYDLHQLLSEPTIKIFFDHFTFYEMLLKVANDDVESFKNNNSWLAYHPKEALIFRETEKTWKELERTYSQEFSNLVYGELPPAEDVLATLKEISERLQDIKWNIDPNKVEE
ncbi:MAG: nucleotidyl transferase AbiEii/AbiGii toxin family protein [Bacteroidota bacterium]